MPQVGERKTVGDVTGEWDGSTWRHVQDAAPNSDAQEPAMMRFLGGAAKTSPLNPMNLGHAIAHPLDTLWNTVATPVDEARQAINKGVETVTGSGANGRMISAAEMLKHLGGAVPFIGKPMADAGDKIGNGDLAGGAGELAGVASGALLPKVPGAVAKSMGSVGRGAEALGKSKVLSRARDLAPLEAMTGHIGPAIASVAAPTILQGGGRLLQKGSGALDGLIDAVKPAAAAEPYVSQSTEVPYNWGWHKLAGEDPNLNGGAGDPMTAGSSRQRAPSAESNAFTHEGFVNDLKKSAGVPETGTSQFFDVPGETGFKPREMPTTPQDLSGSLAELSNSVRRSKLKPIDKFYEDNPGAATGGEGRMTGQFDEGSGGLADVASGAIQPRPSLSPLDELSQMTGRALTPEAMQALMSKYQGFGVR